MVDGGIVMGGRQEPGLKWRRRQVHPPVEHGVEEGRIRRARLAAGRTEVPDRLGDAEEGTPQSSSRSVAKPAAVASGFPDSVPVW